MSVIGAVRPFEWECRESATPSGRLLPPPPPTHPAPQPTRRATCGGAAATASASRSAAQPTPTPWSPGPGSHPKTARGKNSGSSEFFPQHKMAPHRPPSKNQPGHRQIQYPATRKSSFQERVEANAGGQEQGEEGRRPACGAADSETVCCIVDMEGLQGEKGRSHKEGRARRARGGAFWIYRPERLFGWDKICRVCAPCHFAARLACPPPPSPSARRPTGAFPHHSPSHSQFSICRVSGSSRPSSPQDP